MRDVLDRDFDAGFADDDLRTRLHQLAAPVDDGATNDALSVIHAHKRRRTAVRTTAAAAMCCAVALVVFAAVSAGRSPSERQLSTIGPVTAPAPDGDRGGPPTSAAPSTAASDITITLTPSARSVRAGDTIAVGVTIANTGRQAITYQAHACGGLPVDLRAGDSATPVWDAAEVSAEWDGTSSGLLDLYASGGNAYAGVDVPSAIPDFTCRNKEPTVATLDPGAQVNAVALWKVRLAPAAEPASKRVIAARFTFDVVDGDAGVVVTSSVDVGLTDDSRRTSPIEPALDAFANDPAVQQWLDDGNGGVRPTHVNVAFVTNGWEIMLAPVDDGAGDQTWLVAHIDPSSHEVWDVHTVGPEQR